MDDYRRMIHDEDGRNDQEIWNLVGSHPLIAQLQEMFSALVKMTMTLDVDDKFFSFVAAFENTAYDKLAKKHGPPSTEINEAHFKDSPSDEGWSSVAFHYLANMDDISVSLVR